MGGTEPSAGSQARGQCSSTAWKCSRAGGLGAEACVKMWRAEKCIQFRAAQMGEGVMEGDEGDRGTAWGGGRTGSPEALGGV